MFDLAWYLEWEEGEGAPTWGKMCDFIDVTRCVPCSPSELFLLALTLPGRREPCGFYSQSHPCDLAVRVAFGVCDQSVIDSIAVKELVDVRSDE